MMADEKDRARSSAGSARATDPGGGAGRGAEPPSGLNPHIFRAYDVRGKVGSDITPEVFRQVGRAYGTLICRSGGKPRAGREINAGKQIALGQDNRLSSAELTAAFAEGVLAAGVSIVDIGLAPTPILYFATAHWNLDGGANVTGSHNPVTDNGVKMVHAGAVPLTEDEIQDLRRVIEAQDFETGAATVSQRNPKEDYIGAVAERVRVARRLKVVVDAGNAVAALYGPELLRRLGCEVIELYCELDGRFPHHLPDPEVEENMRDLMARVVEVKADLGIAYDGDADRMGLVDDKGRRHEADLILILLARDLLTRHPGAKVVFDVKSSQTLVDAISAAGGVPVMHKTGHSHLKRKMREDGILLGGEVSGHMFFAENYYGVDDALLASAKLIEIAARGSEPLSAQFDAIPHLHATPELKAPCPDAEKFRVVEELARYFKGRYETIDIDGVRVIFPGGWGLVRASNTNPHLTLRFEARTKAQLDEMKRLVFDALARYPFVTLPAEG
ncbi:MAG: phosphomannomutase/phosphoglucomutase [Candidatus Rokubacteria bacterium]|nr:phosphomannomutase/phosphoglucomutase [Candidatus Rokubacteria bacterium]